MRSPKIEYWNGGLGFWFWHLKSANGKIICSGEGHPTKAKAIKAAAQVVTTVLALADECEHDRAQTQRLLIELGSIRERK